MRLHTGNLKRFLAMFLLVAVVCSSRGLPVTAASAGGSVSSNDVNPTQQEIVVREEYYDLGEAQTSAVGISFFSLANGTVEPTVTNEVKWIDRIVLESNIRAAYDQLVEGSDNDGVDDILIDDSYFDGNHSIVVGTETVALDEANGITMNAAMNEVYGRYEPFINAVCSAFDRDHPEVFWLSGTWSSGVSASSDGTNCTVTVSIVLHDTTSENSNIHKDVRADAYQDQESIKAAIAERDVKVNAILAEANAKSGVYEKIKLFNETLTKSNEYNTSKDLNLIDHSCRECISALNGSSGTTGPVCEGYARAFKVLCDAAGIPCVLVDGQATNSSGQTEAHMWNYAQVDGAWYAVDVTWNDPVISGASGVVSGYESEEWLLVGSGTEVNGGEFIDSHPVSNTVLGNPPHGFTNGPQLNVDKYDYVPALTDGDVVLDLPAEGYTYDGYEKEPTVIVTQGGVDLTVDTDYTVSYSDNTDEGESTAVVTVTGKGSYGGTVTKYFTIKPKEITPNVTVQNKEYDGTDGAEVTVDLTGLKVGDDDLSVTAKGTFDSVNVGTVIPVAISLTVSGTDAHNYQVLTPTGQTANIDQRSITIKADPVEKYYGEDDPQLTYAITSGSVVEGDSLNVTLSREVGEDAKTYMILMDSVTHLVNPNYSITYQEGNFTIKKASYTAREFSEQIVVYGVGAFAEPEFLADGGQRVEGVLTYEYDGNTYSYADLETKLKSLVKDATADITYTFVPNNKNYDGNKSGTIQLVIKDVEFLVADTQATANNAVTYLKNSPTYGDSWAEIVELNAITASIGNEIDTESSHFTLDVSGTNLPQAGEQTFHVYYNGTLGGNAFTNVLVCTGTVYVNGRTITVDAGDYKVTKVYDGTTNTGIGTGNLAVSGILSGDEDAVTVDVQLPTYTDANVGKQTSMDITLSLEGSGNNNYLLEADRLLVPCEITRRQITVKADNASKVYGAADKPFTWQCSEGTSLADGDNTLSGKLAREEGDNVGTYEITQGTLTDEANPNYQITFVPGSLTIKPASYSSQVTEQQSVIQGVCSFVEPAFTGVGGDAVPGTLTYTYNDQSGLDYDALVEQLKQQTSSDTTHMIQYSFIPVEGGNYTGESSGDIYITIENVKFYAGQEEANEGNAVTEKTDPVYGDTWGDILTLNTNLSAQLLGETDSDQSHFRLDVTNTAQPSAGQKTYHIYYSGTLKGVSFENVEVCSGTVTVAPKTVTPNPGTCGVSKEYDGTTAAGTVTGEPELDGVLDKDAGKVSLIVQPADYTQAGVHSGATMAVAVSLDGSGKDNYQLSSNTINVFCMITRRTVTVEAGDYIVSKIYDGTTSAGTGEVGDLKVSGILEEEESDVRIDVEIPEYGDLNVGGQSTLVVVLGLSGDKADNYQLAEIYLEVPCQIIPMTVRPVITVAGTYSYTGSPIEPAFTVAYENGSLTAADYTVDYADNQNAGTAKILLTAKEGSNYTWIGTVEQSFEIQKVEYTGVKEAAVSVMYGNQETLDLASLLPEGAKLGQPSVMDAHSILSGTPAINETTLGWNMVDDAEKAGKTAQITVPVTETTNYLPFDFIVTVTCVEKNPQTEFAFANAMVNKVYGDSAFTEAAQGAADGSTVTYTSSNTNAAVVDNSGKVQIVGAGTAVITASASETNAYTSATVSYTLNIAQKALTWDVSGLSATDREDSITNKAATLSGELKVTGILDADKAKVSFTCPADQLIGVYQTVTPGTVPVELVWADTAQPVTLQGEKAGNYLLPVSLPQITGTIREVMDNVPMPPESTDEKQYKLSVEIGVSNVPDALKHQEKWNTPEKITTEMKLSIQKRTSDIPATNVEVYDVELLININGTGWVKATKDNFPVDGLTVTLPYPNGTGKDTHDFTVAHLFIQDVNGRKAGDLEYPAVTKTDEGIQFKVYGLSPISIGWKAVTLTEGGASDPQPEDDQAPKTDDSTDSGAPAPSQTSEQTPSQTVSPATGDIAPIMLYILLFGAACISMVAVLRRKITNK